MGQSALSDDPFFVASYSGGAGLVVVAGDKKWMASAGGVHGSGVGAGFWSVVFEPLSAYRCSASLRMDGGAHFWNLGVDGCLGRVA